MVLLGPIWFKGFLKEFCRILIHMNFSFRVYLIQRNESSQIPMDCFSTLQLHRIPRKRLDFMENSFESMTTMISTQIFRKLLLFPNGETKQLLVLIPCTFDFCRIRNAMTSYFLCFSYSSAFGNCKPKRPLGGIEYQIWSSPNQQLV